MANPGSISHKAGASGTSFNDVHPRTMLKWPEREHSEKRHSLWKGDTLPGEGSKRLLGVSPADTQHQHPPMFWFSKSKGIQNIQCLGQSALESRSWTQNFKLPLYYGAEPEWEEGEVQLLKGATRLPRFGAKLHGGVHPRQPFKRPCELEVTPGWIWEGQCLHQLLSASGILLRSVTALTELGSGSK